MQSSIKSVGILANVDYSDSLAWYRAREVLQEAKRKFLTAIEKCNPELLVDAFYIHYRKPIIRKPRDLSDEKLLLWYKVVITYIHTGTYSSVIEVTQGNARLSRIFAVRLLKVYLNMLSKVENSEEYKSALYAEMYSKIKHGTEPSAHIKSIIHKLEHDIKTEINFTMGQMKKISEVLRKTRSVFGNVAGDEVAEILLDPEDESTRLRLVEILRALIELAKKASTEFDLEEKYVDLRGYISGIKKFVSIRELRDMTPTERAKISLGREVLAYKLGNKNILVRELKVVNKPRLYMLIDKSGSMFYSVDVKVEGFENLNKITWATALALALLLKGGKVVVRFFDRKAHEALTDKALIVKTLLQLTPLGGTSITNALKVALQDAERNPNLKDYKLVLITDGEDSNIDVEVLMRVQKTFREFTVVLVGGENYIIEKYCRNVIKLKNIGLEALKQVLRKL